MTVKNKRTFYFLLHLFFWFGVFYAFSHFFAPFNLEKGRLKIFQVAATFTFYFFFAFLTFQKPKFKKVLAFNILLLVFPWGLFLLFAPLYFLGLSSFYWRILGGASLVGALIYSYLYLFYRKESAYYLLLFGMVDNFLAAVFLTFLFILGRVSLFAWSVSPLLFYFSRLFKEEAQKRKK